MFVCLSVCPLCLPGASILLVDEARCFLEIPGEGGKNPEPVELFTYNSCFVVIDLLSVNTSKPPALAVKRINWDKLDRVDDNTVWAKVASHHTSVSK